MTFSQMLAITGPKCQKNKKLALTLGIQTYQILTNDDEVCIPSISSILLAVQGIVTVEFARIIWNLPVKSV